MSNRAEQFPAGLTRLDHAEAEQLISLRVDIPLPAEQNRVLLAHLATCPACRAFAASVETMGQGLRSLPMLAASPTVSRQVRERIAEGQSPWARLMHAMVGGRHGAMPALGSAVALVAVIAFALVVRGDNDNNGRADRTPIPAAVGTDLANTATATRTAPASATPYVTRPVESSATVINVVAPKPSATFTPEPVAADPTVAATRTPRATSTATPTKTAAPATNTATETVKPTETATETPQPSATITPEPTETGTPSPTRTPTATETVTHEPTETNTPEPTVTDTPRPTRKATATETNTPRPTATNTPRPTRTATATETNTPEPTATNTPRPTRTPTATEEPTQSGPPTIAPANGGGPTSGDEPTMEPDSPTESTGGDDPNSTQILPAGDESPTPEDARGGDPSSDEETPQPDTTVETASLDETGPLDESVQIATLGDGVSAPAGGLRVAADGGAAVIKGPDGGLAVVDSDGNLLQGLGSAVTPMWSPMGMVLLYGDLNGGSQSVATWDRTDGAIYSIGADPGDGGPVADIAIGWIGSRLYYLRSFLDSAGNVELHSADYDGGNDQLVWIGEGVQLAAERPETTSAGVLLPTLDQWLLIDEAGNFTGVGVTGGSIGEPILSPDESLLAYSTGGQIAIASPSDPGNPWVTIDYPDGVSGFAFSPSGAEIVVSDGATLRIYSTSDGSPIGEAASLQGATATHPYWGADGIRYLHIDDTTTLNLIDPAEFA